MPDNFELNQPEIEINRTKVKKEKKRTQPKALSPQTLADLLRKAYSGKPKRLTLKNGEIIAIRGAWKIEPSEWDNLLKLSEHDKTLEKTRELMLASIEWVDAPTVVEQVRNFVREALLRHPAFSAPTLIGLFRNNLDELSIDGAVRVLLRQPYEKFSWPDELPSLKKKEVDQCRSNALFCLLIWFRETRGTSFDRILRFLKSEVWDPSARGNKTDSQKLRMLMGTKDPAGMAIACSLFEKEGEEKDRLAELAQQKRDQESARAAKLEGERDSLRTQLDDAKVRIAQIAEELEKTRWEHGNELAHMRNDYEELRGRILRCLREELSLLDEGLHALRRDPPKVHVMVDHAERVIDGLKREMEKIKGEE